MTHQCQYLAYRESEDGAFEGERAYCTVVERFVQPMRADVCNRRYDLAPERHCEYYREHEGLEDERLADDRAERSTDDRAERSTDDRARRPADDRETDGRGADGEGE